MRMEVILGVNGYVFLFEVHNVFLFFYPIVILIRTEGRQDTKWTCLLFVSAWGLVALWWTFILHSDSLVSFWLIKLLFTQAFIVQNLSFVEGVFFSKWWKRVDLYSIIWRKTFNTFLKSFLLCSMEERMFEMRWG